MKNENHIYNWQPIGVLVLKIMVKYHFRKMQDDVCDFIEDVFAEGVING